jgi:hypothetical protein
MVVAPTRELDIFLFSTPTNHKNAVKIIFARVEGTRLLLFSR